MSAPVFDEPSVLVNDRQRSIEPTWLSRLIRQLDHTRPFPKFRRRISIKSAPRHAEAG